MEEEEKGEAGTGALICSFLFPIVGIILYFVKKNDVTNPSSYLFSAIGGIVLGFILKLVLAGCAQTYY